MSAHTLFPEADLGFALCSEEQSTAAAVQAPEPAGLELFSGAEVWSTAPTAMDRRNQAARAKAEGRA